MLFEINILSDENDDFIRRIAIDADASFLDLNNAILEACNYSDDQITSFFVCNDEWEQGTQITREDMGTGPADQDVYIMESASLRDFIEDEEARFVFVFDTFNDRVFYLTIHDIQPSKHADSATCIVARGEAPEQITIDLDPTPQRKTTSADLIEVDDDDIFGGEGFDQDDLDLEGFEIEEY